MLAEARVGTSGFDYREWIGRVYPREAGHSDYLPIYAHRLAAVEIAGRTILSPEQAASWAQSVPGGFQFALKAPARVSHELAGARSAEHALSAFLDIAGDLGEHLGPVLVSAPWTMKPDRRALASFLRSAPAGLRIAVELRSPGWHDDATLRVLSDYDAALVLTDAGDGIPPLTVTASFTYVRIRRDDADPETMAAWAEHLALLTRRGIDVYAFLKQDRKGIAVEHAQRLSSLLRTESDQGEQAVLS